MALGKFDDFLAYLIRKADSTLAKVKTNSVLAQMMSSTGVASTFNKTTDSLEAIRNRLDTLLGGAAIQTRTEQSLSGPVEEGARQQFAISIYDIDTGAVASASIDITSIVQTMEKSTGGGAFSTTGITQPTFAKANGLVSVEYTFVSTEWKAGDVYKLTVSTITATVGGDTAYIKAMVWSNVVQRTTAIGQIRRGAVTTATSTTQFVSTDLTEPFAGKYIGWWVTVEHDAGGSGAAPQGEWRQISASTAAGLFTHAAFTAQTALADIVKLVPPEVYQTLVTPGGAVTIKDIEDNQAAMLDYAKNVDTSTMTGTGTEDTIYDKTSTTPFHAVGIWLGLHNMAAGDVIRFRGFMDFDDASIADQFTNDDVWTFGGAQQQSWVYMPLNILVTYELKFTAEQRDGTNREIYTIVDDGARGS